MTCREFHRIVAPLTLIQVARSEDERILSHGRECAKCGSWLEQQRGIAGALHTLQARTVGAQAGPAVEAAVLRSFRQRSPSASTSEGHWFAPLAFRLSRWLELGAYAAATAAVLIGLVAGAWYWQNSHAGKTHQARSAPQTQNAATVSSGAADTKKVVEAQKNPAHVETARADRLVTVKRKLVEAKAASAQFVPQAEQKQGYIELMLCDPLICSGDAQVVRMELPANSVAGLSNSAQPLMADVVVGDDGVVRAVRIVQ